MTFVFTETHVLTHYVSYSSKICVSTFSKTNVSDSGPWSQPREKQEPIGNHIWNPKDQADMFSRRPEGKLNAKVDLGTGSSKDSAGISPRYSPTKKQNVPAKLMELGN